MIVSTGLPEEQYPQEVKTLPLAMAVSFCPLSACPRTDAVVDQDCDPQEGIPEKSWKARSIGEEYVIRQLWLTGKPYDGLIRYDVEITDLDRKSTEE